MHIDRKKIKKYFIGRGIALGVVAILLGFILNGIASGMRDGDFLGVVGTLFVLGGIGWIIYAKLIPDLSGEKEVDNAIAYEIEQAKQRGLQKLNLIAEQIENVDPVVVSGRGFEPISAAAVLAKFSFFKQFVIKILNRGDEDPIYRLKIGSDSNVRCSLLKVTVFMFGEKQLYIYYSNIDLCSGLVYSEGTNEIFYSDISGMNFTQDRERIFNPKNFRFQRVLFESVDVYANGCSYSASLSTDLNRSIVDAEFAGMRTLIRERKNAD